MKGFSLVRAALPLLAVLAAPEASAQNRRFTDGGYASRVDTTFTFATVVFITTINE